MARDEKLLYTEPTQTKKRKIFSGNGRKEEKIERKVQEIQELNAGNANQIVDELTRINWMRSKLPKSALEKKSKETQTKGDLQSRARAVINLLTTDNSAFVSVDLSRIDRKLITIAQKFNDAVADGQVRAAEMASYAIAKAGNIRSKVPTNGNTEEYLKYMDAAEDFLDTLINSISLAVRTDEEEKKYNKNEEIRKKKKNIFEGKQAIVEEELNTNPLKAEVIMKGRAHLLPGNRSERSNLENEVIDQYQTLESLRRSFALRERVVLSQKQTLADCETQLELMRTKISEGGNFEDLTLLPKIKEEINGLFKALETADQEHDKVIKLLDEVESGLHTLDTGVGEKATLEFVQRGMDKVVENMIKKQEDELKTSIGEIEKCLNSMGIRSKEQQAKAVKEKEELREYEKSVYEQEEETEEEPEVLMEEET